MGLLTAMGAVVLGVIAWQALRSATNREAHAGHRPAFEATPAVTATFLRASYRPGDEAQLVLWRSEDSFTVQVFRVDPAALGWTKTNMEGTAVSPVYRFGETDAHEPVNVRIGNWRSGVFYARLEADGLTGFAPFVVRPTAARRAPRARRPPHLHLAGLQLPRRRRRRTRGHLVRREQHQDGPARPAVPRPRRPVTLHRLRPSLPRVARGDGQAGRLPTDADLDTASGAASYAVRTRSSSSPATTST